MADRLHGILEITPSESDGRVRLTFWPDWGNLAIGGNGTEGDIAVFPAGASPKKDDFSEASIWLNGQQADLMLGGQNASGEIVLFRKGSTIGQSEESKQSATVWIDGRNGNIALGGGRPGDQVDGDILMFPTGQTISTTDTSKASIWLNADAGDIILRNADLAEDFDLAPDIEVPSPGTVMTIDPSGSLRPAATAYDARVAGIVSGAGPYRPAIVLDRQESTDTRTALAIGGKVMCYVDAGHSPMQVGDLLTTSDVPGHAMKAVDRSRAFGSVIGKALGPLDAGRGLVPVLVSLQ